MCMHVCVRMWVCVCVHACVCACVVIFCCFFSVVFLYANVLLFCVWNCKEKNIVNSRIAALIWNAEDILQDFWSLVETCEVSVIIDSLTAESEDSNTALEGSTSGLNGTTAECLSEPWECNYEEIWEWACTSAHAVFLLSFSPWDYFWLNWLLKSDLTGISQCFFTNLLIY